MPSVLVVDDDEDIRLAMRTALEDEGYRIYEAPDGEPALARMREHPEGLVVLLDLNMPGINGVAVLRALAADSPLAARHAYILCTAAYGRTVPLAVAEIITHLRVALLPKPFDIDLLLQSVAAAVQRLPGARP